MFMVLQLWSADKTINKPRYGGPDGELGASLRYLSQRFNMVTPQARAVLNDVGISLSKLRI